MNYSFFPNSTAFDPENLSSNMRQEMSRENTCCLFDVHGTIAANKQMAPEEVFEMLKELKKHAKIGFVTGSEKEQVYKQLGNDAFDLFDYGFTENGTQFHYQNKLVSNKNIKDYLSDENYKKLVDQFLKILSETESTVKRGQFITLRNSTINISPIGRSCSVEERIEFYEFDKKNNARLKLVSKIKPLLDQYDLDCAIGGQISVDIFPRGWDKTYCLRHIKEETIYFFGDMTEEGQNDHKLFVSDKTIGHKVESIQDTTKKVREILAKNTLSS